jgi:hypothetical protein
VLSSVFADASTKEMCDTANIIFNSVNCKITKRVKYTSNSKFEALFEIVLTISQVIGALCLAKAVRWLYV